MKKAKNIISEAEYKTEPKLVIGVGFQKTGTSSISKFLIANGLVNPGAKELHAFSHYKSKPITRSQYLSLLKVKTPNSVYGEFTPNYLMEPTSIWNLSQIVPNAKLIASVRNPIDRAFSAYVHGVGSGRLDEGKTFEECIESAFQGSKIWWENSLLSQGLYSKAIFRLTQLFPRKNLLIVNFDTWTQAHGVANFENELLRFTGLTRISDSGIPKVNQKRYWTSKKTPASSTLSPKTRELLQGFFNESKESLENLIGARLGWW
jgi:hypothetical protein